MGEVEHMWGWDQMLGGRKVTWGDILHNNQSNRKFVFWEQIFCYSEYADLASHPALSSLPIKFLPFIVQVKCPPQSQMPIE